MSENGIEHCLPLIFFPDPDEVIGIPLIELGEKLCLIGVQRLCQAGLGDVYSSL